eukprot:scaffold135101_cov13-Tisochrysis_lutea.AAC.1
MESLPRRWAGRRDAASHGGAGVRAAQRGERGGPVVGVDVPSGSTRRAARLASHLARGSLSRSTPLSLFDSL